MNGNARRRGIVGRPIKPGDDGQSGGVGPLRRRHCGSSGEAMERDQMFGPVLAAQRRGSAGRDDAFMDGLKAGAGGVFSAAKAEFSAQKDAQLFFSRHGCPVAGGRAVLQEF